jgi:hypothetical protein
MDKSISTESPKQTNKDYALAIIKGAIGSVPVPILSGVAAELFSLVLVPPITKRNEEWVKSIAEGLIELQNKVEDFKIENLSQHESFITTLLHATESAMKNHQVEKLEALKNAVLNSALPNPPEEDLQLLFVHWVDELSTWHLRILQLFDDPVKWAKDNNKQFPNWYAGGIDRVLLFAYPELEGQQDIYSQFFNDLNSRNLTGLNQGTMTGNGMVQSRTTAIGKRFLQFITAPKQLTS